jgi:ankyrin repeat protein
VNLRGYNCLHVLCKYGGENGAAISELLLDACPSFCIDKQDADGNTGLLLAYTRGQAGLCKALVKAGACLGVANKLGVTIFNYQLATKTLLYRLLDCVTNKEPPWAEADCCLECGIKFSITTRRHHW